MPNHLRPTPDDLPPARRGTDPAEVEADLAAIGDLEPLRRPPWWRWVAIALIVALVVAAPLAYGMSVLLR